MSATTMNFSSDGFDLDALAAAVPQDNSANDNNTKTQQEVVYELGGKISVITPSSSETNKATTGQKKDDDNEHKVSVEINEKEEEEVTKNPLQESEECKQKGNEYFGKHLWQDAYEWYTKAIQAVPYDDDNQVVYTGEYLLKKQKEWEMEQNKLARERIMQEHEEERKIKQQKEKQQHSSTSSSNDDDVSSQQTQQQQPKTTTATTTTVFQAPPHPYAENLAVYYNNRAAALLQLEQMKKDNGGNDDNNEEEYNDDDDDEYYMSEEEKGKKKIHPQLKLAIQDCTIAIYLKPDYVKALVRRGTAYERTNQTDKALCDMEQALSFIRTTDYVQYKSIKANIERLQQIENERLEKLKTETLDKLKDLGNSILSNFGLSLNNFQATKDPNTGSYSISFNNNNNQS